MKDKVYPKIQKLGKIKPKLIKIRQTLIVAHFKRLREYDEQISAKNVVNKLVPFFVRKKKKKSN